MFAPGAAKRGTLDDQNAAVPQQFGDDRALERGTGECRHQLFVERLSVCGGCERGNDRYQRKDMSHTRGW
jgi:hypothetical protein